MTLKERLERLLINLENFDLVAFFHDDTFFQILEDRQELEKNYDKLSQEERKKLQNIDRIIDSYYNIYKNEKLDGYAKYSFKLLEEADKVASQHLTDIAA